MDEVPKPPPNLRGDNLIDKPQHWRFLLGRHGRGVNVSLADGSARWVRLDDMYTLTWKAEWIPRPLQLPSN
jgi:prepilin-type processing-associated H-X9-DG protein